MDTTLILSRINAETLEYNGVPTSTDELSKLSIELEQEEHKKYEELMKLTPAKIKRKHLESYKGSPDKALSFSRSDFLVDILFTPEGFNLKPRVFTETTKRLPEAQRKPSTSSKEHLPYFKDFAIKVKGKDDFKYVEELI